MEIRRKDYVEPSQKFKDYLNSLIGISVLANLIILFTIIFTYLISPNFIISTNLFHINFWVMIWVGLISTYKGYFVDGHFIHGTHHLATILFFLLAIYYQHYTYTEGEMMIINYFKPFIVFLVYLTTRMVKRFYDCNLMSKNQWIVYYTCYSYVQSLILLHSIFIEEDGAKTFRSTFESEPIKIYKMWWIGAIPLCDNLVTLRSQNLSEKWFGKYFWCVFNYIENLVIKKNNDSDDDTNTNTNISLSKTPTETETETQSQSQLQTNHNCQNDSDNNYHVELRNKNKSTIFKKRVLPVIDTITFWSILSACLTSALLKNTYSGYWWCIFGLPLVIDRGLRKIKLFSKFKRPFAIVTDVFLSNSKVSFPSGHAAIITLFTLINYDFSIINRIILWLLVCIYRLTMRAHTLEDILAGTFFAYFFHHLLLEILM
jgi:hypothetical protein